MNSITHYILIFGFFLNPLQLHIERLITGPYLAKNITLTYTIEGDCDVQELELFTFTGVAFKSVQRAELKGSGFIFQLKGGPAQFYFIGPDETSLKSVILGQEKNVQMTAKCASFKDAQVVKSKINQEYASFLAARKKLNNRNSEVIQKYRGLKKEDVVTKDSLNSVLAEIDAERIGLTTAHKSEFVNKLARLFAYQSFQNNKGMYEVEMEYFAENYFNQVDFSDPIYNQMSVVYEAFANYTSTLSQAKMTNELHASKLAAAIANLDESGQAYKFALGAVVNTLYQMKHRNMPSFATIYVNKFYETDKEQLGPLKMVVDQINAKTIGAPAPDIVLNNPSEEEIALSSLKGNVVLIDFWASWCGPCRRENPNVVRMYNKYKDQGFEIYGVSLDKNKDRWVKAIEADGLTWAHVSDLKGWQSDPAAVYGVRSIPTTILIDGEGKIIARNLRGASLEAKLEELFN